MNLFYIQLGVLIALVLILQHSVWRRLSVRREFERREIEMRLTGHGFDATEINARIRTIRANVSELVKKPSKRMAQERFALSVRKRLTRLGFFRDLTIEKE